MHLDTSEVGTVVIDVCNSVATVSRYELIHSAIKCIPAFNAPELEREAAAVVSADGGNLSVPGRYPCPPELAAKASFPRMTGVRSVVPLTPMQFIVQPGPCTDENGNPATGWWIRRGLALWVPKDTEEHALSSIEHYYEEHPEEPKEEVLVVDIPLNEHELLSLGLDNMLAQWQAKQAN